MLECFKVGMAKDIPYLQRELSSLHRGMNEDHAEKFASVLQG